MIIEDATDKISLTVEEREVLDRIIQSLSEIDYDQPLKVFAYPVDDDGYNQLQVSDGTFTVMTMIRLETLRADDQSFSLHAQMFIAELQRARKHFFRVADLPPDLT